MKFKQIYGQVVYHKLGAQVHQHNTVETEQNSSKVTEGRSKPIREGLRTSDYPHKLMHTPNQINTSMVPQGGGAFVHLDWRNLSFGEDLELVTVS